MGRRHSLQARVARVWPHCDGGHVGDERQLCFGSLALEYVQRCAPWSDLCRFQVMRMFMLHKDQTAIASCLLLLLSEYAGLSDALLT